MFLESSSHFNCEYTKDDVINTISAGSVTVASTASQLVQSQGVIFVHYIQRGASAFEESARLVLLTYVCWLLPVAVSGELQRSCHGLW